MTKKFTFGYALALTVLLIFSYCLFIGLIYMLNGSIVKSGLISGVYVVLIILGISLLCHCKASRWSRINGISQKIVLLLMLLMFIAGAIPTTNFFSVAGKSQQLTELMSGLRDTAANVDNAYIKYIDNRVKNYAEAGDNLQKDDSTHEIKELTKEYRVANLRRLLTPYYADDILEQRQEWLKDIATFKIFNPATPENIKRLSSGIGQWEQSYTALSEKTLSDEPKSTAAFKYPIGNQKLVSLIDEYTGWHKPNILGLAVSLFCFLVILIPYFVTEKSSAMRKVDNGVTTMSENDQTQIKV